MAAGLLVLCMLVPAASVSFHSLCDLLFSCGCRPVWAGGITGCNVHMAGVPHCPFCTGGLLRFLAVGALCGGGMLAGVIIGIRRARSYSGAVARGVTGGVLGFALTGLLIGGVMALWDRYPRFLFAGFSEGAKHLSVPP